MHRPAWTHAGQPRGLPLHPDCASRGMRDLGQDSGPRGNQICGLAPARLAIRGELLLPMAEGAHQAHQHQDKQRYPGSPAQPSSLPSGYRPTQERRGRRRFHANDWACAEEPAPDPDPGAKRLAGSLRASLRHKENRPFLIQEGAIGRNSGSMRGYRLLEGCTIQKGRPVGVSSLSAPMKSWYRRRMRHNMCCTIGFWLGGASDQT